MQSIDTRKLSVFIGSKKKDLEDKREEVINAVLNAGHIPCGMELWAAGHVPTKEAIKTHLSLCDIHIIILGARHGTHIEERTSFVEWEYKLSEVDKRPVIAFLLQDKDFEKALKSIEAAERKDIRRFRDELSHRALCRFFPEKGPTTIATDCVNSIAEAINSGKLLKDAGWIRSHSEHGKRLQSIEENPFLQRILTRIHQFSTLTTRVEREPEAKMALGDVFWDLMFGRIKRFGYTNLFFESGSTLAFVSSGFEKKVLSSGGDRSNDWHVDTNNALALLQLLLHTNIETNPLPPGPPEGYYGAMFGSTLLQDPEAPPGKPRRLFPREDAAIKETSKLLKGNGERRLFLATASGLDLTHKQTHFRGPHIGSHPNMLFKRAIFQTGQPIVLFLTEEKIDKPFIDGTCYPVFGPDYPWSHALRECPLAICIGHHKMSANRLKGILKRRTRAHGFDFDYASKELEACGVFIAANEAFSRRIRKE